MTMRMLRELDDNPTGDVPVAFQFPASGVGVSGHYDGELGKLVLRVEDDAERHYSTGEIGRVAGWCRRAANMYFSSWSDCRRYLIEQVGEDRIGR